MIVFDRLLATEIKFDRLVDIASSPFIASITGAQDGEPLTITGTGFSASDNTAWAGDPDDSDTEIALTVATEGTTEIVTEDIDAGIFWLTRQTPIFVRNSSGVASNVVLVTFTPKATERTFAVTQAFLGDGSSRIRSEPDLEFGDEIRIRSVAGAALADPVFTGQGVFDVDDGVTQFEAAVFSGEALGDWALQTIENLVTTAVVPDVEDLTQSAATAAVQSAGLIVNIVASVPHLTVAAGSVIVQFPAAGVELPLGGTVELTLSLGALVTLVPNLDGIAQAEAETIRTAAGLTGTTHRVIDGNNTGTVIGQSIAPGTVVAIGTALDLAISSNLMPDLVGELIQTAEAIILAAGLTLDEGITEEFSDAFAQGEVISQTPVADSAVAPGDPVTLTVSLGEAASVSPLSLLRGRRIYRNTRHALHSLIEDGGGEEEPTETIWNDIWGDIWDDIWADAA